MCFPLILFRSAPGSLAAVLGPGFRGSSGRVVPPQHRKKKSAALRSRDNRLVALAFKLFAVQAWSVVDWKEKGNESRAPMVPPAVILVECTSQIVPAFCSGDFRASSTAQSLASSTLPRFTAPPEYSCGVGSKTRSIVCERVAPLTGFDQQETPC